MAAFHREQLALISRREFLKRSSAVLLNLFWLPYAKLGFRQGEPAPLMDDTPTLGRVLTSKIDGYDQPSFKANLKKSYWQDLVLPITAITLGDDSSGHNRVWYQINHESYVHSGGVQPVEIRTNPAASQIAPEGQLVEVTVPFTDTYKDPQKKDRLAYRLYYATTYWVFGTLTTSDGTTWYQIQDDKWDLQFYVNAAHVHIITADEVAPLSPMVSAGDKRIEIHLPEQYVIAYEADQPVFMTRTATGARFRDGDYRTPEGIYVTSRKRPSRHMAAGDPAAPNSYDLPGIPWVSYLIDNGISIHGTYWHNNYGRPRSHGCINLSPQDARWIYRWTTPYVPLKEMTVIEKSGTIVETIGEYPGT